MRMLMCIPDATSKWGLGESEWVGLQPEGLCVHDEPQSKCVPDWSGNGYAVSACLFACLFACLLSHVSVPIWREEVRTCICEPNTRFLFRLGICTTLNISHTHAEIEIGHLPDSIFHPRSGKDVDWRSPKDTEDIILKFERWWRVDELDAILPCPW